MNSFGFALLFCFIGLTCAQFDDYYDDHFGSDTFGDYYEDDYDYYDDYYDPYEDSFEDTFDDQGPRRPNPPTDSSLLTPSDCVCRMKTTSRIVRGQVAAPNSVPWQISLASRGRHTCGGSIVNRKFIVTAAHCLDHDSASQLTVRVGLYHLRDAGQSNTFQVKKIHKHPSWSGSFGRPGDYALLELAEPIKFIPGKVEPACINNVKEKYQSDLIVSGWGAVSPGLRDQRTGEMEYGEISPVLKMAFLYEDRNKQGCESFLICINSRDGSSPCQGDSGGPIHILRNGRFTVEGVSSFGDPVPTRDGKINTCAGTGAYSSNSYYKEWFEGIVGQNYCRL